MIGSGEPSGSVGYDGPACVVGGGSVVGGAVVVGAIVVGAAVVSGACVVVGADVVAGAASLVGGATVAVTSSNSEVGAPTVIASSDESPPVPTRTPATTPPTASTATSPNRSERFGRGVAVSASTDGDVTAAAVAAELPDGGIGGGGGGGVEPDGALEPKGGSELSEGV